MILIGMKVTSADRKVLQVDSCILSKLKIKDPPKISWINDGCWKGNEW
jgi:hypothetical protein